MTIPNSVLDRIKKECENMKYGNILVNVSPKGVTIDITTRLRINDDRKDINGKTERLA